MLHLAFRLALPGLSWQRPALNPMITCAFCGITRKAGTALMIRMDNGRYRCKGAVMCLRRARAIR